MEFGFGFPSLDLGCCVHLFTLSLGLLVWHPSLDPPNTDSTTALELSFDLSFRSQDPSQAPNQDINPSPQLISQATTPDKILQKDCVVKDVLV